MIVCPYSLPQGYNECIAPNVGRALCQWPCWPTLRGMPHGNLGRVWTKGTSSLDLSISYGDSAALRLLELRGCYMMKTTDITLELTTITITLLLLWTILFEIARIVTLLIEYRQIPVLALSSMFPNWTTPHTLTTLQYLRKGKIKTKLKSSINT